MTVEDMIEHLKKYPPKNEVVMMDIHGVSIGYNDVGAILRQKVSPNFPDKDGEKKDKFVVVIQ